MKLRGFRVEPGEIEALLLGHPDIKDAAVVVREDETGKRLVGYLTPREGKQLEAAPIREWLRQKLPEYMVPSALIVLDSLPLNPNGKLDRRALPAPEPERTEYEAPRSPLEQIVAQIWCDVLRLDKVGIHDNFFDLGGHSLLVARVQSRLRQALGRDVSVVDFFKYPTVESLAQFIAHTVNEQPSFADIHDRAKRRQAAIERFCWLMKTRGVDVEIQPTSGPGDASRLAAEAARQGSPLVIVSGGDGTINEALQGLVGAPVRLAIWPRGTANVLGRELRLPRDMEKLADTIAAGNVQRTYVGCATIESTATTARPAMARVFTISPSRRRMAGEYRFARRGEVPRRAAKGLGVNVGG